MDPREAQDMMRQLLSQMHNISTVRNHRTANIPAPAPIPPCPGLRSVTDEGHTWFVPRGETTASCTYCQECRDRYRLDAMQTDVQGSTNCDSFLVRNKIDNGVFNISFWSKDLRTLLPATENAVQLASGQEFAVLVHGNLKDKQHFRYRIRVADTDKYLYESKVYARHSLLTTKKTTTQFFTYLAPDAMQEGFGEFGAFSGDLEVVIDIFTHKQRDIHADAGVNYGRFIVKPGSGIQYKAGCSNGYHVDHFNFKQRPIGPSTMMAPYTQKPLVIRIMVQPTGPALQPRITELQAKYAHKRRALLLSLRESISEKRAQLEQGTCELEELLDTERELSADPAAPVAEE